jgi:hypothetical protein
VRVTRACVRVYKVIRAGTCALTGFFPCRVSVNFYKKGGVIMRLAICHLSRCERTFQVGQSLGSDHKGCWGIRDNTFWAVYVEVD